jgi:NET1-associated nuclear protein 1 (U3 small nucleolar RNA-associated protein 17)
VPFFATNIVPTGRTPYDLLPTKPSMTAKREANGETAALKKRKRDKTEEERRTRKKHRSKSGAHDELLDAPENAEREGPSEGLELVPVSNGSISTGLSSETALGSLRRDGLSSWTVSNPMGGRMLDIDPIFSVDEQ